MFKIQCIDHIVLRTNNLEKLVAFYCDLLGCKIEKIIEEIGLIQLRAGESLIDLLPVEADIAADRSTLDHFCLRIKPFDYEFLKSYFHDKGVLLYNYGTRHGAEGYGESVYLKDPEGNEIELKSTR